MDRVILHADANCFYAAVYCGQKQEYPNYPMYVIDLSQPPYEDQGRKYLTLAKKFSYHAPSGIYGLPFPYGSTGMIALGDGLYYFSEDGYCEEGHFTHIHLYRYDENQGFVRA